MSGDADKDKPAGRRYGPGRLFRLIAGGSSSAVIRNTAVLTAGVMGGRVIGIAAIPILTRIYSSADFGLLAIYTSLIALLVPAMTLGYDMAIPLPRTDRMAFNIVALCVTILTILIPAQVLLLWLFNGPFLSLFSAQDLAPYWGLMVVATLSTAVYQMLSFWAMRKKQFKVIARIQVSRTFTGSATKIGLGLVGLTPLGLLIGQVLQQAGGVFPLARSMLRDIGANRPKIDWKGIRFAARRYVDMPRYRLPSQLLIIFSVQAPLLFSAGLFDIETTGQLSLAILALGLPMQLFGRTIGKAYYAEIAAIGRHHPKRIREISLAIIWRLAALSVAPCLVLLFFGPNLFSLILGSQWQQAGVFASLLAVYLATQFISSPLVHTMNVFGRQDLYLKINVIRTIGVVMVFGVSWVLGWEAERTILVYSLALTCHYLFTLLQILRLTKPISTS